MALLEELDLSYDYIGNLPALKEIALLFPNVRIILNHLGGNVGPTMDAEGLERWKAEMADVAASCPNVFCKCVACRWLRTVTAGRHARRPSAQRSWP